MSHGCEQEQGRTSYSAWDFRKVLWRRLIPERAFRAEGMAGRNA